jgi:GMP reductase
LRRANEKDWKYDRDSEHWQNRIYEHISPSIGIKYDPEKTDDIDYLNNITWNFYHTRFVCIDAANGYTARFCDFIKRVREAHPALIIIAGNVVTGEMTEEIILSGADIVKVGIGSGSVCTTRIQTGVGYPQFSAVVECADAAHGVGGYIMADGGCTNAGDIAKAFGGGADFVMLGGMLAGHTECEGQEEEIDGQTYKTFYGMSSTEAMKKYNGGVAKYRSAEGKTVRVKHRGLVKHTLEGVLGGLRSACTYIGAKRLKDMPKCATFLPKTSFDCCVTRIKVAHFGISFNLFAPMYVQADLNPPKTPSKVCFTSPLCFTLTVLPSALLYLATPPLYFFIASVELIP